jgi:hypothetical protein
MNSSATSNSSNETERTSPSVSSSSSSSSSLSSLTNSSKRILLNKSHSQPHHHKHSPSFDSITIYEFSISIGDNPAAREGCPVALGSKCVHKESMDVETFELFRDGKRRRNKQLYLPVEDRAAMLLSRGYSLDKIVKRVMEMEEIKKSRTESLKMNGWERMNIAIDAAGKTLRKLNLDRKKKASDSKPNQVQARMA